MEQQILVGQVRMKLVDHLQRWSQMLWSEGTEMDLSIDSRPKFPESLA